MKILMLLMVGLLCSCATDIHKSNNELETKFYTVSSNFLENVESKNKEAAKPNFQAFFEDLGIEFPAKTKINFVEKAMRLVVTSSPKAHEKLENTLKEINTETPQFMIQTKIYQGSDVLSAPMVTVLEGKQAVIRIVEERYLPVAWESPNSEMLDGNIVQSPPMPIFKDPKDFGITLDITANKIDIDSVENTIHIQGKTIFRNSPNVQNPKFQKNKLLTEHLHSYSEDFFNYSLFIKNGGTRKVNFKTGKNTYTVEFTVKEIDSVGLPKSGFKSGLPDFKRL